MTSFKLKTMPKELDYFM